MTLESHLRYIAAPIIRGVIQRVGTGDPRRLAAALRQAYPWGEKRMHPYLIWRDEIRRQLNPTHQTAIRRRWRATPEGQMSLCNDGATMCTPLCHDDAIGGEASAPPNPIP